MVYVVGNLFLNDSRKIFENPNSKIPVGAP